LRQHGGLRIAAFSAQAHSNPAQLGTRLARRSNQRRTSAGADGRSTPAGGEISLYMASATQHVEQLERHLLRRGVGELEADRDRCADCGRTPLTGEHVHLYEAHGGEIVCELCRTLRRQAPIASEIVRHTEHGQTVRLTARAA
jgi:hypothetical protein